MGISETINEPFRSTRHEKAAQELAKQKPSPTPRLGRRESEPHSAEISYLHDVLTTNFPNDRTIWDLHHYFMEDGEKIDLQFDISYFRNLKIEADLPSYDANKFKRVPTLVINILSSSTYNNDLGAIAMQCQRLNIPVYAVFSSHIPSPKFVSAPFLGITYKSETGYHIINIAEHCCDEEHPTEIDFDKVIDVRPDLLPFKFGIMKLKKQYLSDNRHHPRYRLVLIDRKTNEILKTKAEKFEEKWKNSQREAEEFKEKWENSQKEVESLKKKLKELEQRGIKQEKE